MQVDEQTQCSQRNCLRFHEIEEQKGKDIARIIINTVKEGMDLEILPNDLSQSRRIENQRTKKKEIPIIVKFVR